MWILFLPMRKRRRRTGKEPEEALDIIAKMCSIAIVKVGARGSLIRKGTEEVRVEAVPVAKVLILPVPEIFLRQVFYMD